MYIIDIIRPSIVINGQKYHDVPHSRKILAQETFDLCSEIMKEHFSHVQAAQNSAIKVVFLIISVRSLKRQTVISFEHFDQKKYA